MCIPGFTGCHLCLQHEILAAVVHVQSAMQSLDLPSLSEYTLGQHSFGGSSGTPVWMRCTWPTGKPQAKQERQTHKLALHRTEGSQQNNPWKLSARKQAQWDIHVKLYWGVDTSRLIIPTEKSARTHNLNGFFLVFIKQHHVTKTRI